MLLSVPDNNGGNGCRSTMLAACTVSLVRFSGRLLGVLRHGRMYDVGIFTSAGRVSGSVRCMSPVCVERVNGRCSVASVDTIKTFRPGVGFFMKSSTMLIIFNANGLAIAKRKGGRRTFANFVVSRASAARHPLVRRY